MDVYKNVACLKGIPYGNYLLYKKRVCFFLNVATKFKFLERFERNSQQADHA